MLQTYFYRHVMHAESIFAHVTIMMVHDILKLNVFSTAGFLVYINACTEVFLFAFCLRASFVSSFCESYIVAYRLNCLDPLK